ncbi:MAG: PA14 domain-containing protein, partial [Verrucomicrobiota bacterium]
NDRKPVGQTTGTWSRNNYGARMSGLILPPVTGTYRFYLASDDASQLRLNTGGTDGAQGPVVASVTSWVPQNNFTQNASQASPPLALTAGVPVGFEALMKQGGGGNFVSVAWSIDGGPIQVIPGHHLAHPVPVVPPMTIVAQPVSFRATLGSSNSLSIATTGPIPALFQWRRNGVPIEGANEPILPLADISAGSAGRYDCTYTTIHGTTTSEAAWVFVTDVGEVVPGGLWREIYTGLSGSAMAGLTGSSKFPYRPDSSGVLSSLYTPSYGNAYGQRWTGWVTPTNSGNYRFYLASDDDSELWLGTNQLASSASRILTLTGFSGERSWSARSPSAYLPLVAGQSYYIEVRHKEGGGGDHCAVAWQLEGTPAPANGSGEIGGGFLSYRKGGIYPDTVLSNVPPFFLSDPLTRPAAYASQPYLGQTLAWAAADTNATDILLLSYAKESGPAWLQVAADGTLTGTPGESDLGTNHFTLRVTDPGGLSGTANLQVTVHPANHAPAFAAPTLTVGGAVAYQRFTGSTLATLASDPDAWASLTFAKVAGPEWLSVSASGALGGVPAYTNSGPNTFTVRVTDEGGLFAEATLAIPVQPA